MRNLNSAIRSFDLSKNGIFWWGEENGELNSGTLVKVQSKFYYISSELLIRQQMRLRAKKDTWPELRIPCYDLFGLPCRYRLPLMRLKVAKYTNIRTRGRWKWRMISWHSTEWKHVVVGPFHSADSDSAVERYDFRFRHSLQFYVLSIYWTP